MSGIIGKLNFHRDEPLARPALERMLDAIEHRGRRGRAVAAVAGAGLGACSDTDTAYATGLVARNQRDTVRVVADAALTNARDLRAFLARTGSTFTGDTDAEVIAHAYDRWGAACVERLQGPFACAIWDADARRLLLARDHLGLRPLCFALLPGRGLVFASEPRALFQEPGVVRDWCPVAIDAYLTLGYVPAPLTSFRRISKLEPAHRLVVEGRAFRIERYWDLPLPSATLAEEPVTQLVEDRLRAAVGSTCEQTRIDGTLFSGGTASAALLAVLPERDGTVVNVALEDNAADAGRIRRLAGHLGATPRVELQIPDVTSTLAHLASTLDEPLADPGTIDQYAVCVAAKRHGDTMLAAHGAAALWAGFARHRVERVEQTLRSWLPGTCAHIGSLARPFQGAVPGARALSHLAMPPAEACATKHADGLWADEYRHSLYTTAFARDVRDESPFARHIDLYGSRRSSDALDRALYVDARTYLPDSTVAAAESVAMAIGMRLQFPFLSRDLVELAARVPAAVKQANGIAMQPLRALVESRLPAALTSALAPRPARHPWLEPALSTLVPRVLLTDRFDGRGIVSRPALTTVWDEHLAGHGSHSHRLWSLLMLELWFREHVDDDATAQPFEHAPMRAA